MNAFAQKEGLPGMGYIFWRNVANASGIGSEIGRWLQDREVNEGILAEILNGDHGVHGPENAEHLNEIASLIRSGDALDCKRAEDKRKMYFPNLGEPEAAGPLAKNIGPERTEAIRQQLGLEVGDAAFFLAGKPKAFEAVAGRARDEIGRELKLIDEDRFAFAWIVDFPIYERDEETGKVDFEHNPFSMPQGGMEALEGDPLEVLGYQYDLSCNGYELVSGAIRNHKPEIMFKAFEIAGYGKDEVEKRFGGMVNAFKYGAPPHGGCAAGIDRIVMLLADEANIREVIMFPMNQRAEDLMMGAPNEPMNEQLRELHLRVIPQD